MSKKSEKMIKEWIEITLCDMLDEIRKNGRSDDKIMTIIKRYATEIYNAQNDGKK